MSASGADWRVDVGDCVERMAAMPAASVDAVVTDPPYHLSFMGRAWDHAPTPAESQAQHARWAVEALRVLKPGGHLLAFGGTRTYHRLACAIEDAGFEIRDTIAWLYGSGFPKSLDVGKAIDKAAGAEPRVTGPHPTNACPGGEWCHCETDGRSFSPTKHAPATAPATPDAQAWDGWGTALKPAHEPIVVARKPLAGTVAGNVQAHGTGALNVDGCRVGRQDGDRTDYGLADGADAGIGYHGLDGRTPYDGSSGRWPANVALDPEAAAILDAQTGELTSGSLLPGHRQGQGTHTHEGGYVGGGIVERAYGGDKGGASRFFYVAKASSAERNAGLDAFEEREARDTYGDGLQGPRPHTAPDYEWQRRGARNSHPTVKPVQLMRWLCRLVTPPGGLILDPFAGSGTTGAAAVLEGFRFVGIERDAEYARIAEARIGWWAEHPEGVELVARLDAERERKTVADGGQDALFA
jgi:DNA modification methylase